MRVFISFLMFCASLSTSGCAVMNARFSCNVTADDCCLSIEQVDAMTRYADKSSNSDTSKIIYKSENSSNKLYITKNEEQPVWIKSHSDKGLTVYASKQSKSAVG